MVTYRLVGCSLSTTSDVRGMRTYGLDYFIELQIQITMVPFVFHKFQNNPIFTKR